LRRGGMVLIGDAPSIRWEGGGDIAHDRLAAREFCAARQRSCGQTVAIPRYLV
jgi:hypothetical protein